MVTDIDFVADAPVETSTTALPAGEVTESLSFGLPDTHLVFSKPIKVEIVTPELHDGEEVTVYVQHADDTSYTTRGITLDPDATCTDGISSHEENAVVVINGTVTFYTCGASSFIINAGGTNNLKLWLKANTGTSCVVSGCAITGWTDKSTSANNAT